MKKPPLFRTVLAAAIAACALSCTRQVIEAPPSINVSPEEFAPAPAAGRGATLGLVAEANESDSLEKLERLPGVRVASVVPGGPAAAAGIAAGDVVLSVDGIAVDRPDALDAIASKMVPGSAVRLEARRNTTAFEAHVTAGKPAGDAPPAELYRADPVKLRAGFRTAVVGEGDGRRVAAELVKLFPGSPLEKAGARPGDLVMALSGKPVASAQDLVRRAIEDHEYGERVTLAVVRGGKEMELAARLWEPERRLSRVAIPILFNWECKLRPSSTHWAVIDLWIFSIFAYRRDEGERELRFLSLFRFRTGYGELIEEPRDEKEGK